ncbi:hypothetical protein GCM10027093_38630 [Paraburkholderia jirisanensis]
MTHGTLAAVAIAIATAAASLALTRSALASGYGPAPFYQPADGAPASQRGMSTQALAADDARTNRTNGIAPSKDKQEFAETMLTAGDKH